MRALLLLLPLAACFPAKDPDGTSGTEDTGDTGGVDTADTQDTEDTGVDDTGDTDTGPDDTGDTDTGPDDTGPSEGEPPLPGDLLVTEFMYNPAEPVSDATGEWFEVENLSGIALDLDGVLVSDDATNAHTIAGPLVFGPGDRLVIGRSRDGAVNGGAPVDYAIPGTEFEMSNSADEIVLSLDGTLLDRVAYDEATFPNVTGYSVQLRAGNDTASNDVGTHWCQGTRTYGDGVNVGTPGGENEGC